MAPPRYERDMPATQPDALYAVTHAETARALLDDAEGILLDWDGCTATANRPRLDAVTFIARYRRRIAIVSNNSTHLPADISAILGRSGIDFPSSRVILAGAETLGVLAERPRCRAMVLAAPRLKALARNAGVTLVKTNADVVALLRDTKFSFTRLERAVVSLSRGARLVVANPDTTHPGPDGTIVPETGALLAAIGACIDLSLIDVQVIGKPSRFLFERACAVLNVSPAEAVMVGDNLLTDAAGAKAVGMPSVIVAPGSALTFADLAGPGAEMAIPTHASRRPAMAANTLN
jgi:HAD superfamily hydrolase (TIGR01450 family)